MKSSHEGARRWLRVGVIGQKVFEGRAAVGYNHDYGAQKFYLD